jgi:hypothetical protein
MGGRLEGRGQEKLVFLRIGGGEGVKVFKVRCEWEEA